VGPVQGRACGVEQETSPRPHLQKIENFSVKTRPAAALHRCLRPTVALRRRFCGQIHDTMYLARISMCVRLYLFGVSPNDG
jgi:hypothetical protein